MKFLRKKVIHYLTKNLLVALTEDDILTITNKAWYNNGKKLSPEEVANLKDDADAFSSSELWRLMNNLIRNEAYLRMFEKNAISGNSEFGRAMLYNLELIKQFIKDIKNY